MKKIKILTVVGARPQFIKAAVVSRVLRKKFKEILLHTGQHYDIEMSENFFKQLKIPKTDYNLDVGSDTPNKQIASMLEKIEPILLKEKPRIVLVYGDTNSTLAGALAAAKLNIPVAHIEAGLRSYRRDMPEEINRVLTDHLSTLLFCPTKNSVRNLYKEGINKGVYNVGDVILDAVLFYYTKAKEKSRILSELNIKSKKFFLVTIHRPQNTDSKKRLAAVIDLLGALNNPVIFPIHPRTKKYMKNFRININTSNKIYLINPVSYFDMLVLEANAKVIFTDSGGVQKEAYFLNTPCFILRDETEWIEILNSQGNQIIGIGKNKILEKIKIFDGIKLKNNLHLFGNGKAAEKIYKILTKSL